jgi:hypothetical protein
VLYNIIFNVEYPFMGQCHQMGQKCFQIILDRNEESVPFNGSLKVCPINGHFMLNLLYQKQKKKKKEHF